MYACTPPPDNLCPPFLYLTPSSFSQISYLYSASQSFTHNNTTIWIYPYPCGALELSTALPFAAKLEHETSIMIENLNPVVVTICDDYMTFIVNSHAKNAIELGDLAPFLAELQVSFSTVENIYFERTSLNMLVSYRHWNLNRVKKCLHKFLTWSSSGFRAI